MGAWRAAALAAQFGFSVVGSMIGGIAVGLYLDRQFDTPPVFFLVGLLGGLISSIYLIYLIYRVQVQPRRTPAASRPVESAQSERPAVPLSAGTPSKGSDDG